MKKKAIISILLSVLIIILIFSAFQYFRSNTVNSKQLSDLEGTIYYMERVDGVLTLFKSDATLQNKKLVYSHKGKGKDGYGSFNDNILDFQYNQSNKTISFIAMDNGSWSLFTLEDGKKEPTLIQRDTMQTSTDYLKNNYENLSAYSKEGSLYLSNNGEEEILKEFNGKYDEKMNSGYSPLGFSPDGKYLVYRFMGSSNPAVTLVKSLFSDSFGDTYIMDLSTMESIKYIDSYEIQWIID